MVIKIEWCYNFLIKQMIWAQVIFTDYIYATKAVNISVKGLTDKKTQLHLRQISCKNFNTQNYSLECHSIFRSHVSNMTAQNVHKDFYHLLLAQERPLTFVDTFQAALVHASLPWAFQGLPSSSQSTLARITKDQTATCSGTPIDLCRYLLGRPSPSQSNQAFQGLPSPPQSTLGLPRPP